MMNKSNIMAYTEIFNEIEKLYLQEKYKEIIDIANSYEDIYFLDKKGEKYSELAEIFAVSYIELKMWKKALTIIDNHLDYLIKEGFRNKESKDDLTTFCLLKIEIYQKRNSLVKQLKTTLNYIKHEGDDKQILEIKSAIEEELYLKYVTMNKIIMYTILVVILFDILMLIYRDRSFFSIFTTIGIIWFIINYAFHKRIKPLFIRTMNLICT